MKQCSECKWWGLGQKPITGLETGQKKHCARLSLYDYKHEKSLAYIENGDYASSESTLWTQPGFGCALWSQE